MKWNFPHKDDILGVSNVNINSNPDKYFTSSELENDESFLE